jgi:hypothetical protein
MQLRLRLPPLRLVIPAALVASRAASEALAVSAPASGVLMQMPALASAQMPALALVLMRAAMLAGMPVAMAAAGRMKGIR